MLHLYMMDLFFPGVFAFPNMVCISRVFYIPPGTNTKTAGGSVA